MTLPSNELRAILNHVVGRYVRLEDCTEEQRARIDDLVKQRLTGMPLAKIIGSKEFWKHRFITTKDTLDPRPDSETLIEAVLKTCPPSAFPGVTDSSAVRVESVSTGIQEIKKQVLDPGSQETLKQQGCQVFRRVREANSTRPYRILDLGTGTGCLLISLLEEYPEATGVGVDISEKALKVAEQNSILLGLSSPRKRGSISYNDTGSSNQIFEQSNLDTINGSSVASFALAEDDRIEWIQSNWCENLSGTFDIIVCNPPYIDPSEPINEGAAFDPPLALYGGIHTYEAILQSIDKHLDARPKHLFFEIGYAQAADVAALLAHYSYHNIQIFKDLSGHDRVVHTCV